MSGTADLYRRWARVAARGSSPIYEQLALAVAEDGAVLRLLESVEFGKRQPNLLFGALRWHGVPVEDPQRCLAWARAHPDRILAVLRTRRTQTNEVARCATILPALAQLPQPLALIEVGASAGLCLLYDYQVAEMAVASGGEVVRAAHLGDPHPAGLVRGQRVAPHLGADLGLRAGSGQRQVRGHRPVHRAVDVQVGHGGEHGAG
ncbi:MAG: hypothetical protein DLM61_20330 [Pseudonocardiales bacterium]|nr:MAG: hypothetical protein DLM61_20330 [Pseudonocardiales bacterium]